MGQHVRLEGTPPTERAENALASAYISSSSLQHCILLVYFWHCPFDSLVVRKRLCLHCRHAWNRYTAALSSALQASHMHTLKSVVSVQHPRVRCECYVHVHAHGLLPVTFFCSVENPTKSRMCLTESRPGFSVSIPSQYTTCTVEDCAVLSKKCSQKFSISALHTLEA